MNSTIVFVFVGGEVDAKSVITTAADDLRLCMQHSVCLGSGDNEAKAMNPVERMKRVPPLRARARLCTLFHLCYGIGDPSVAGYI